MKKTTELEANTTESASQLTDQQINEMENDVLWNLLDDADSSVEASPMFSRNVMREIRLLDENESVTSSTSFWQRIISPNFAKYGLGLAVAAVCAFLVTTMTPTSKSGSSASSQGSLTDANTNKDHAVESSTSSSFTVTEDAFTAEIFEIADQDPLFMSEEDIDLAMNF